MIQTVRAKTLGMIEHFVQAKIYWASFFSIAALGVALVLLDKQGFELFGYTLYTDEYYMFVCVGIVCTMVVLFRVMWIRSNDPWHKRT